MSSFIAKPLSQSRISHFLRRFHLSIVSQKAAGKELAESRREDAKRIPALRSVDCIVPEVCYTGAHGGNAGFRFRSLCPTAETFQKRKRDDNRDTGFSHD